MLMMMLFLVGYHIGRQSYDEKYSSPSHLSYDIQLPHDYTARVDFTHLDYPEQECMLGTCTCEIGRAHV